MKKILVACWVALCAAAAFAVQAKAADDAQVVKADSLKLEVLADSVVLAADTVAGDSVAVKKNFFRKIADYFATSNQYDPTKKMDFGIIAGPHYSSTVGFGLGIVASGIYSLDKSDPTLPLSNLSLFGDVTTTGFLMIGVRGNNVFAHKKYRLDYGVYVYTFPSNFWGIGYENGSKDENKTSYSRLKFEAKPRFLFRLYDNLFLGPMLNFQYINNSKFSEQGLALLGGQDLKFNAQGAGVSLMYDSRDVIVNATRGWFVQLDQMFYPSFFGNDHEFFYTDLTVSTYHKAWKGAVIAGEYHSLFNYKDVPWPMMALVGGPNRMRGYYEGRYRDRNIMEAQIELRQHLWKRHGMVVWFGAANVFPDFDQFKFRQTLLNGGVGYRWAFKQNVNVRLDLGVTKHGVGFLFNINEAF